MPRGLGSLTRGLSTQTQTSPLLLVPQVSSVEVDGSAFRDLPRLEWNNDSGMAHIGSFPAGGRLSLFLPEWQKIILDCWVPEVVSQGYLLQFKVSHHPCLRFHTRLIATGTGKKILWDGIASQRHRWSRSQTRVQPRVFFPLLSGSQGDRRSVTYPQPQRSQQISAGWYLLHGDFNLSRHTSGLVDYR